MRNRPLAFFNSISILSLILVLASACAPSPADTIPDTANQEHSQLLTSTSHQQSLFVPGVQQFDLISYSKIPLVESQLEVSSTIDNLHLSKANLIQPGAESFWHVKFPKEETRSWVLADMKTKQTVTVIGILGRKGKDQMWYGYRAVLEASNDKKNWDLLARLGLSSESPKDEWTYFTLPEPKPYRYYRLSIHDWSFMSMARLTMYVTSGNFVPFPDSKQEPLNIEGARHFDLTPYVKIPLVESQLEVSSYHKPWDKSHLVKPGTEDFWHIERPRQEDRVWVLVDLETARAVPLLRIRPRAGFADQMWYGYTAELEASNDKQNWTPLAVLGVPREKLTDDWMYFLIGNLQSYRYYRLSVWDRYFYSMARLELYQLVGYGPPLP